MATNFNIGAGQLRHKVAIQNVTRASDSKGGYTESWTTSATVWADVRPLSSNEEFRQRQIDARASLRVIMRYNSSVTHASRLLFGSRVLSILSVRNPDERKQVLDLICYEGQA